MRRTKIVCTLGPTANTPEVIGQLMEAGMNVARFNFSHGDHDTHRNNMAIVTAEREKRNLPVATLLDTRGPEVRLRFFEDGKQMLVAGDEFILHHEEILGDKHNASLSYPDLYQDLTVGDTVLFDDGLIELTVNKIEDKKIYCTIVNGGKISDRKGVNIPDVKLSLPYVSEQDHSDLLFGIEEDFDFVAASFVRSADDVMELREILKNNGGENIRIISKIENAEGVENIDEIIRASDGIMVARGDMGVEIAFEKLPYLQKMMIKKSYRAGKIVITATQMLESMVTNPRPTRAEVSDVANAVYDGTSAIMLSGETAAGDHPVEAVRTMARIAVAAEDSINYKGRFYRNTEEMLNVGDVTNAISHATCSTAYELDAKAIITVTISGRTARNISKFRPSMPIIGCTTDEKSFRQMGLAWGVEPLMIEVEDNIHDLIDASTKAAGKAGYTKDGDVTVLTTGVPLKIPGTTNLLKVHIHGETLMRAKGLSDKRAKGKVCIADSFADAKKNFQAGDILVLEDTSDEFLPLIKEASGIVCEAEGFDTHIENLALTLELPIIAGAKNAREVLREEPVISVDAQRGLVSRAVLD